MSPLQQFASFVKNEKFEDFVCHELQTLLSYNIPLLQKLSNLSEAELLEATRKSLFTFLQSMEEGKGIEVVKQRLHDWKNNKLPGIDKKDIGFADIILVYSAQKNSLFSFIPFFTADAGIAVNIVLDLENYYKQVQQIAVEMLQEIEQEEQQRLEETEEKYKDLFENATDLIQIADVEGKILFVNNAWERTIGYSKEELTNTYIYDYLASEEKEKYKEYRKKVIANVPAADIIHTCFIAKNKSKVFVEGSLTCKYKNGKPEYLRGILRDVTKRRESYEKVQYYTQQLEEREENLKQLITNAPDAIIVIDENNIITLWNPKAEAIFGWQSDEVCGQDLTNTIIPDEYKEGHRRGVARFLKTGQPKLINTTVEITAITKQKKQLYISLTLSQTRQAGKTIFISFIRDITQQKKNELELENKQKELVQSNLQLEQYAWLVSHDLKEPLRKIITYSDLLSSRFSNQLSEQGKNYLSKIFHSTQRMDRLIEAILEYSQIAGTEDQFVQTDLRQVIDEVLADLEILIANKKGKVLVGELPGIDAIHVQIRQLFQNLITNALKYSKPDQHPLVEIFAEQHESFCTIYIKDNGIGFDEKYAEKIFVVFQRLQAGKKEEGTGIGLAICKKIVETHKGTIKAESIEGVGTTFKITLPLKQTML